MSATASGADARPHGEAKSRQHHDGSHGRAFTVEQKAAVVRIKRCSTTAYYEILGLEAVKTTCSESDIKKAYRKLSLLTHPDKNGYQGADEAFKLVSRAFQVLSDPDKKAKFDRFGGDPDARFPGAASAGASSPFSNFARSSTGRPGPMFEEELTPEEMFRQFFGGGGAFGGPFGGGGIFDTGPAFVFNVGGGGPGVRVHQFGGGRPRRRPGTAQPPGSDPQPSVASALSNLLPLLLLFLLPLLSSVFGGGSTPQGPSMVFEGAKPPFTKAHVSERLHVHYWVNPAEVDGWNARQWKKLDATAENKYIHKIHVACEAEQYQRARMEQDAQGWFFQDEAKMEQARRLDMKNCRKMKEMGIIL